MSCTDARPNRKSSVTSFGVLSAGWAACCWMDGEPGIGKSLLLRDATDEAAEQGFSLAAGAADQLGQAIPFFALRAALREPFAGPATDYPGRDLPDAAAWWITQIRARLQQRAAMAPILVCLDDLHWASPATLAALRALPHDLETAPGRVAPGPVSSSPARRGLPFRPGWRRTVPPGSPWPRWIRTRWRPCSLTPSAHRRTRLWPIWPAARPGILRSWLELIGGLRDDHAVQVSGRPPG